MLGSVAIRLNGELNGEKLRWDSANLKIPNSPEAEALLVEAVRAADEVFGPTNGYTADGRAQLVRVQVRRGRLDEAAATLHAAESATGPTDENSLLIAASLLALARGDLAAAERNARAELDRQRGFHSPPRQTARAPRAP